MQSCDDGGIDFSYPRIVLLVGKPRSSKSNTVKYWLLNNGLGDDSHFKFGLVFTGSKFNSDYDYVPDDYVYEGYQQDVLDTYLEELEAMQEKEGKIPPNFIVFDDLVGILSRFDNHFINFTTRHRHYNTTILICVQFLNLGANTTLREITSHALMFKATGFNTIESLWKNFGTSFEKYNDWKEFFIEHTKEPFTGLLYNALENTYCEFRSPFMGNEKAKLDY